MLKKVISVIDSTTEIVGKTSAYFSVLMVLVTCYIVVTRYIFNTGSIAVQESVTYLNSLLFLCTVAYTLKHDGHVRVDIFYSPATSRHKAWVNLFGGLFLLMPVCCFILWSSWSYVGASWRVLEQSGSAGGLPFVYLLKSLIIVMATSVILQGLAEILRNADFLFFSDHESITNNNNNNSSEGSSL